MNIKKLFSVAAVVTFVGSTFLPGLAQAETPDTELGHAYEWAHSKGITTMDTYEKANMYGAITRAEMAKMLSVYATEILGKTADTSKACEFSDIASVGGDLKDFIVKSCQLSVMGQNITAFRPYDTITRAEFGTALSRVLWGDTYNNGTPYYANHLNALKEAGIMKQIANADSTKEIRGYVMIMLQRASEGEDKDLCEMCLATGIGADKCEAVCGNEDNEKEDNGKVKAGDLAVSADAAANRKILKSGTSDLDTLTFKTSEEVEITKITLERYGYSDSDQITEVRLEDQDGNIIADGKGLTKDKVTLNIKKDYRNVDGEFEATVVVTTSGAAGTIGFKVTDVESTAKNLNLDDYNPYTYEVVEYVGSTVTVELKGSNKSYNYEEGETYEVARLKVSAGDNAVLVKGFTLTNAGKVDMKESLDELTVKADSKEIKAKASVNKDDELVITFNSDVEIDINKKVTFVLEASFKDFDDYGETVEYYVAEEGDFNAVEKKNGTRVQLDIEKANKAAKHTVYTFNGGKIKLTNKKLGNVDAAQASEGTVVAEGDITITEPISKLTFVVTGSSQWAEKLTLVVNGDEYDGSRKLADIVKGTWTAARGTCVIDPADAANTTTTNITKAACEQTANYAANTSTWTETAAATCSAGKYNTEAKCTGAIASAKTVFTFNNVSIDESGKIQFKLDVTDNENAAGTIEFEPKSIGGNVLSGAKYDNVSKQYVKGDDVAGSISFSKVTIQPAKAALENGTSKDVEYIFGETARKVVFEGTYTARKSDINLNKFQIQGTNSLKNKVTFYLFVDGEEVADTDTTNLGEDESFSDVLVKAGESVKVKVEAEVEAYTDGYPTTATVFTLEVKGTDANGNEDTGKGSDTLAGIKIKGKGGISVEKSSSKNTITLKKANSDLAVFTISPSNGNEDVLVEDMVIRVEKVGVANPLTGAQIRVKVDGVEQYDPEFTGADSKDLAYNVNETIDGKVTVSIALKADEAGKYIVTVKRINDNTTVRTYNKNLVPAVVLLTKQEDLNGTTKFTYEVADKSDSDYTVSDFCLYKADVTTTNLEADPTNPTGDTLGCKAGDIEGDNMYFEILGKSDVQFVKGASYHVADGTTAGYDVLIDYTTYNDYFSINGADARVYLKKN